jgi:outer membrane protein TolC
MERLARLFSVHFLIIIFSTAVLAPVRPLVCPGQALAQDGGEASLVFSLEELIDRAIAVSPEIEGKRSEVAAARSDLDQVKAYFYPQIESTAFVGPVGNDKKPEVQDGDIIDPSPDDFTSVGIFGSFDITLTQPLYGFGKLSHRKEAALEGVKAREFGIQEKKNDVALRVRQLYYALILAREGIEAADDTDGYFEDASRLISRLLELNAVNVSESDLYRIEAFRADTLRGRAEAQTGLASAYFALKSMIRLQPDQDFQVVEEKLSIEENDLDDQESYIRRALEQRPELKQLRSALEAKGYEVKATRSDLYPSFFIAAEASVAGAPDREKFDNPYIPDKFNHAYVGAAAGLRWNFDFGIGKAKISRKRAEYTRLRHSKESAEMNIPIQIARLYQEVLERKTAAKAYRKAAVASRKWLISAMADFDMGIGDAEDMLNGIERYGRNQGRYIEALFRYKLTLAALEHASGITIWRNKGNI